MPKVVPAILTNDTKDFEKKLKILERLSKLIQIDIMDGKFIPHKSINLAKILKIPTKAFFEVHLMAKEPLSYLELLKNKKIKRAIFHFEATDKPVVTAAYFKINKIKSGLAVNPNTDLKRVLKISDAFNYVLLMSVHPGRQGQKFIPKTLEKIKLIRKRNKKIKIFVDGGVNIYNVRKIKDAGADGVIVGSGILKAKDPKQEFQKIKEGFGGKKI